MGRRRFPGEIVATDNGDPTDMTAFPSLTRKPFNGLALVIVRAKRDQRGEITIVARADGLREARGYQRTPTNRPALRFSVPPVNALPP